RIARTLGELRRFLSPPSCWGNRSLEHRLQPFSAQQPSLEKPPCYHVTLAVTDARDLPLVHPQRHQLQVNDHDVQFRPKRCQKDNMGGQVREEPQHLTPYEYFEQEPIKQKPKSSASQR